MCQYGDVGVVSGYSHTMAQGRQAALLYVTMQYPRRHAKDMMPFTVRVPPTMSHATPSLGLSYLNGPT